MPTCKYFLRGGCKYGTDCFFSHVVGTNGSGSTTSSSCSTTVNNAPQNNTPKPLCRYFLRGGCKFGSDCRFSHGKPIQETVNKSDVGKEKEAEKEGEKVDTLAEALAKASLEPRPCCEHCLKRYKKENIPDTYALLKKCDHALCVECVVLFSFSWPLEQIYPPMICPICCSQNTFYAESKTHVANGTAKNEFLNAQRDRYKSTRCPHVALDKRCPAGKYCKYAHIDEHGNKIRKVRKPYEFKTPSIFAMFGGGDDDDNTCLNRPMNTLSISPFLKGPGAEILFKPVRKEIQSRYTKAIQDGRLTYNMLVERMRNFVMCELEYNLPGSHFWEAVYGCAKEVFDEIKAKKEE